MATGHFNFKEFSIAQENCAMKVGTDGVLLGAWTEIPAGTRSVLDIGTGTGLIALQLAQRSDCETIDALEIEAMAFETAVENFENSPWSDRLYCYHASLQTFHDEMDERYDLIVCNPPFYNNTYPSDDKQRNLARQGQALSFESLLGAVADLMTQEGTCGFIIPFDLEGQFLELARKIELHPSRITRVRGNETSSFKRSLLQLTREHGKIELAELTIETSRHVYTSDYVSLVKDFYLNM